MHLKKLWSEKLFQSTLPVWGVTKQLQSGAQALDISIHTPRVGSDIVVAAGNFRHADFNPHSPCGE